MHAVGQEAVDSAQQRLLSYCNSQLQATACVRLDCIAFPDDVPQKIDDGRHALRLRQIMGIQGCLRLSPEYRVKVQVDAADWTHRLTLRPRDGNLPELYVPLDYRLIALNHHDLVTAAQQLLQIPHRWWVVDLYLQADSDDDSESAMRREAARIFRERRWNEGPPLDGLVYFRIRYYQGLLGGYRDKTAEDDAWASLLYKPGSRKKDYLRQLLKHGSFPQAFDALMAVPGLAADMSIGNLHTMMALRCDERVLCYLDYIRQTWFSLVGNDQRRAALVDAKTVHALQSRAPAISKKDLKDLFKAMEKRELFPFIRDEQSRTEIWNRLKGVTRPVPTLRTFFRDLRYLAVSQKVMKQLYKPPDRVKMTVDECVAACLDPPANNATARQKTRQGLWELWRFSMQYGLEMTAYPRLQPRGKAKARARRTAAKQLSSENLPTSCVLWSHFAELARQAGFSSPQIDALQPRLGQLPSLLMPAVMEDVSTHQRSGIPYQYTVSEDHWALSLEALRHPPPAIAVTAAVVRQSVFLAFCRDLQDAVAGTAPPETAISEPLPFVPTGQTTIAVTERSHVATSQERDMLPVLERRAGSDEGAEDGPWEVSDRERPEQTYRMDVYTHNGSLLNSIHLPPDPTRFQDVLDQMYRKGYVFSVSPGRGIHKDQCYSAMTHQPSLVLRAGFSTHIGPEYAPSGRLGQFSLPIRDANQNDVTVHGKLHKLSAPGRVSKPPQSKKVGRQRGADREAHRRLAIDQDLQPGGVLSMTQIIRQLRG